MDFWEYVMFDRPVSVTGQRCARKMKEPPRTARRRREESEGWQKGSDGGENGGELWNAAASGHLLARHIPVGSQALNQSDPQNQQKSKVRQAFPEKIPRPSPLLHSFASTWFPFKTSLGSILIPGLVFHDVHHFFPRPSASPEPQIAIFP